WVLGVGHLITAFVLFRAPLSAIWRDGVFGAVAAAPDRRAVFWYLLFTPFLLLAGHVVLYAADAHATYLLHAVGGYLLASAVIGIAALNRLPFWAAAAMAAILLWVA